MTNEERKLPFKGYLAVHLIDSAYSKKDMRDVFSCVDSRGNDWIDRTVKIISEDSPGNKKLALYLVPKDFGNLRTVWFSKKKGAYRTKCPECQQMIALEKNSPNSSLGSCGQCKSEWNVCWFAGMRIIKRKI